MAGLHWPHTKPLSQDCLKPSCQRHKQSLLFVKLGNVHMQVLFGVVENLAVPLLVRTEFIERFVEWLLSIERRIVQTHSSPVPIISKYTALLNLLQLLHIDLDDETITKDGTGNNERTPLFIVANGRCTNA